MGKWGFCLCRTLFWSLSLSEVPQPTGGRRSPLAPSQKPFPTKPLSPLPKRNLPWPGRNRHWTFFSALGPFRLSPRSALAQTINPLKKKKTLRGGNETDLLNLYAAVQIQHHCQVKSLAPLTALVAGRRPTKQRFKHYLRQGWLFLSLGVGE